MKIKFILVCVICLLGACGFRPLYMSDQNMLDQTAAVQIQPISGEGGYRMELILQNKLNPKAQKAEKKYRLTVSLEQPVYSNQSIRSDNFASLEKMQLKANYKLLSVADNKVLISSTVDSNGLFNLIKDPYATVVAQDKLYDNLIQLMAEDIAIHVLAYFKGENP